MRVDLTVQMATNVTLPVLPPSPLLCGLVFTPHPSLKPVAIVTQPVLVERCS